MDSLGYIAPVFMHHDKAGFLEQTYMYHTVGRTEYVQSSLYNI
jgi:hypothetical protein